MTDTTPELPIRYAYKASLITSAQQFELDQSALSWRITGRSGTWPLSTIAAIRLSWRPVSMQSKRYRADIVNDRGERITMYSTTWQTITLMEPQDSGYRDFILSLHRRLGAIGSQAAFSAGLSPLVFRGGMLVLGCVALAIVAMIIRAAWIGLWVGGVFVLAFAALFVWQTRVYMSRNRPRSYLPDAVPEDLLP